MIVSTLREKKAENIRGMDFRNLEGVITDGFIICSAPSERQVGAISEHLRSTLKEQNLTPRSIEGSGLNHWVLIDTGDIVVHIFLDRIREFYRLEQLWGHAPVIALPVSPAGSLSPAEPARG
ncbi:ribosome silencing factor [bacterium]|nr:ribosome silencing factor [candidate division CSSED10-310 bacterium]